MISLKNFSNKIYSLIPKKKLESQEDKMIETL